MSRVMICTPCYGRVVNESYLKSILASQDALRDAGHAMVLSTFSNESLITRARNNLVAAFLGSNCDALMFIDADIGWRPRALLDLVDAGYDVCGTPYPTKGYQWDRVARLATEPGPDGNPLKPAALRARAMNYTLLRSDDQPAGLPRGWQEVQALGTGFMLIQRHVLERMRDHYRAELGYVNDVAGYLEHVRPEHCVGLFETMIEPDSRRYLSEDYAFCRRWRDLGGKVFANLRHRLSHTGAHEF
ncbi:hypothetical protein [Azohydromonas aeria]|uniref:hypothetical protein n=1 Tax=Azohydromonas aeria TaxID=2590212 RepID=UPI0012F72A09|nr:hypothetical protein [Azohydromonas aeria]